MPFHWGVYQSYSHPAMACLVHFQVAVRSLDRRRLVFKCNDASWFAI